MKFYKHFIGDYRKKTNRLSPLEHGVYRLLLDELYGTEDPLPLDEIELQNIVGVRTDQDAKALRKILDRYFTLTPSGWTNERATEEISTASALAEKKRLAAETRWKTSSDADGYADADAGAYPYADAGGDTGGDASHSHSHSHSLQSQPRPEPKPKKPLGTSPKIDDALVVVRLPLAKVGEEAIITEDRIPEWEKAYPAVDVRQQLRAMREWLLANPQNRKTQRGVGRFVVNWLARSQDRPKPRSLASGRNPVDNSGAAELVIARMRDKRGAAQP